MRLRFVAVCLASIAVALPALDAQAPQTGRAFSPADWYRVAQVGSPVMRSDGKFVAMQVTRVDDDANTRRSEIWMVDTEGGEPIRFSAPGTHSTNPRFSPDGNTLIFNSTRPGVSNSVWGVRLDRPGGEFPYIAPPSGAPEPSGSLPANRSFSVTTGGVAGVATPPGGGGGRGGRGGGGGDAAPGGARGGGAGAQQAGAGRGAGANNPYADMPPMARPPANAITLPLDPDRFDGMHITDQRYKANGQGFVPSTGRGAGGRGAGQPPEGGAQTEGRGAGRGGASAPLPPPAQIFVDKFDGRGRQPVTSTNYSHRNATVSPDGRWIAFLADTALRSDSVVAAIPTPPQPQIRDTASSQVQGPATNSSDIFIIPAAGGTPRRIETPGNEGNVQWSPDSRHVSYSANKGRNTSTALYLVDVQRGVTTEVTEGERFELGEVQWLRNNELMVQLTVGGRSGAYKVNPRMPALEEAIAGRRRVSGLTFDSAMTRVAYVSTSVDRPTEIFLTDASGANERKLTGFNDSLIAEVAFSPAEQFMYKSVGDVEIEAWLMHPHGYQPGRKYPVVLYIHGGPHSAYGEGWFDEFQNIAGAGMFVLFTNPRGSSGFGPRFSNMIRGRWGDEDYMDIMKAVDIVAARPDVDSTRMGVTGGSYGGFMTAWITTKTNRFKAAQADRMIANWVSWYGISDAQSLTEGEFFGTPWQNWELYDALSPMKYADKVQTPTLIVQSEEDHRTPMADAEQWFVALKKHNVPAEFIRYPRSTHDLSRTGEPWLLVDRLNRLRQWFSYWLKDESATRIATPAQSGGNGLR